MDNTRERTRWHSLVAGRPRVSVLLGGPEVPPPVRPPKVRKGTVPAVCCSPSDEAAVWVQWNPASRARSLYG